ncbi:hypothetical protein AB4037_05800 [Labrys sp. KB_33_2]|uniref:hypothetical protein n=1 Tax=Labrys sp. KB_33_2 TaxID=3237479 RepID=UPI003F91A8F0
MTSGNVRRQFHSSWLSRILALHVAVRAFSRDKSINIKTIRTDILSVLTSLDRQLSQYCSNEKQPAQPQTMGARKVAAGRQ